MSFYTVIKSPVGELTALSKDGKSLSRLNIGRKDFSLPPDCMKNNDLPLFVSLRSWLARYFDGERPSPFDVPLDPADTPFRAKVRSAMLSIPYGETVSYGKIAQALGGGRLSSRAVGNAVGSNPFPIIVPCHRVIGSDGTLHGYAFGLDVKRFLLSLEKAV